MYSIDDYNYELPEALIAQKPAAKREFSRLLHLNRKNSEISHYHFHEIISLLAPGDTLVVNDTQVIPGRLLGRKSTGGKVEVLILDYFTGLSSAVSNTEQGRIHRCLVKSSKKTA